MNLYYCFHELKRQFFTFIIWFICLGLLLFLFIYNFPTLSSVTMKTLLGIDFSVFSNEILDNLQLHILPDLSEYIEYFAFFVQFITAACCFYATYLGINAVAEDMGSGVAEFLVAQPVNRFKVLLYKMATRVSILFTFNFLLWLLSIILSVPNAPKGAVYVGGITSIFITAFLAQLIFLFIGFCVSCFWSNASQASGFSMALVFFSILIGAIAPLLKQTSWLRKLSPYHLSPPVEVIKNGYLFPFGNWLLLVFISAVFLAISCLYFKQRNISVRS